MTTTSSLAFIFPGQGSQQVGMLGDFYQTDAIVAQTFSQAGEVLGYDLWNLIQAGPQDKLNMTEVAQPALLASSVALWRLWMKRNGPQPAMLAGHSLGEWSALVCAEVVAFEDAIKLVRLRGKYMQEAVPAGVGAMAAVLGLADDVVEHICRELSNDDDHCVVPVNYNSPGQLVIAGHQAAVDLAIEKCKEAGAKRALLLQVSAPFHTTLMKPAAERLAKDLDSVTFNAPKIPVIHNVDAAPEMDPASIKQTMIEQIYSPVKWVDCVNQLKHSGISHLIECGPGKVLTGLTKRIDRTFTASHLDSLGSLEEAVTSATNQE